MFEDVGAMSQLNFDEPIDCVFCPVNDNLRDADIFLHIQNVFQRVLQMAELRLMFWSVGETYQCCWRKSPCSPHSYSS